MKRRMYRMVAIVLTLILLCPASIAHANAEEEYASEQKVYSNAALEDDFANDRIMVVLSNEASLKFKSYSHSDFEEIACKNVMELTSAAKGKTKEKFEAQKGSLMRNVENGEMDVASYHEVICLELEEPGKENVLAAIEELQKRDDVIYAGPDYVLTLASTTPNDEEYASQWAATKIQLPAAWDITTGSSSVTVGVIDSGIMGTHTDLVNRIDTSLCRDFTSGSEYVITSPVDTLGHGTHVAGIIGAQGNNEEYYCGVCWNVRLTSLRCFEMNRKGYASNVALAINFAEEQEIPILNLSACWWNDGNELEVLYDRALNTVIENYSGLIVCCAGNEDTDIDEIAYYPAEYKLSNVITVGASTSSDQRASFSNYGATTVDVFAPGEGIWSTHIYETNGYKYEGNGTSFAAPYVTGVAALLLSKYPDLSPCEIKATILNNVDDCGTSFDNQCVSEGRLNAYKALTNVVRHTFTYTHSGTSDGHTATCQICNYSRSADHDYEITTYSAQKHAIICSDCQYTYYASHTWNSDMTKCLVCGFNIEGSVMRLPLEEQEE